MKRTHNAPPIPARVSANSFPVETKNMHIHLTRDSEVLALYQTKGLKEWKRISIDQLQSGLTPLEGQPDVVIYCSADNPYRFAVDPPKASKLIVKLIAAHNIPMKFLVRPLHPLPPRPEDAGSGERQAMSLDYDTSAVLRISAFKNGDIHVEGRGVTLDELDALLAAHVARRGVVWYYREDGQAEPPPMAMAALELITNHKRPVSMSGRADFSDTIDEHGNSRPREH